MKATDFPVDLITRFWSYVQKGPECWLWTRSRTRSSRDPIGYGQFFFCRRGQRKNFKAHRIAWEFTYGPIPKGMWVLHRCDNPACVNPEHLFLGDQYANMSDAARKGRTIFQRHPDKILRGSRNGFSRFTESQVLEMRRRYNSKAERAIDISRDYGVSDTYFFTIVKGRRWKHVGGVQT